MIKDVHINNTRKLVEESGTPRRRTGFALFCRAGAPLAMAPEGGRAVQPLPRKREIGSEATHRELRLPTAPRETRPAGVPLCRAGEEFPPSRSSWPFLARHASAPHVEAPEGGGADRRDYHTSTRCVSLAATPCVVAFQHLEFLAIRNWYGL
jgi:hypothetical protein